MKNKEGFTLIELLVVIAIIALLLAIVIPSLKNAKRYAAAAVCLANESQLGKSYFLYAEDHGLLIPDGDTSDNYGANAGYSTYSIGGRSVRVHNWVGHPMNATNVASNTTLEDKIRGFQAGSLWPYIEAPKAYHCPADRRFLETKAGVGMLGYRSYSIGKPLSKRPSNTVGEVEAEIEKTSQFVSPSDKFIFLEEAEKEYGWNNKTWNMQLVYPPYHWIDPVAVNHNDSSTFVFADGHAARRKWVDEQTRKRSEAGEKQWDSLVPPYEDWFWVRRAYMPGRKPAILTN